MNEKVERVEVRPGVGMLALFPAMNYRPWYAMGEFVDNSLQSWRANLERLSAASGGSPRLIIEIEIDRDAGTITVTDNAAGIAAGDIPRAFTPASPPADSSGLSQFGIGMKSAASWFAKDFVITTTALGEPVRRTVHFDIPAIVESGSESIAVQTSPAPSEEHGTKIVMTDLNHGAPTGRTLGKIRDYLSSIYRRFLLDGRVEIIVGGRPLTYEEPEFLVAPRWDRPEDEPTQWRKELEISLPSGRQIRGWAGLLKKGDTAAAGFALLYRGKVVQGAGGAARDGEGYKPAAVFGRGNSFESQRLIGELDVSPIPVTHTKDSLVWDADDEQAFLDALAGVLDEEPLPLLRMARNYRSTERGRAIQATVQKIVGTVARAVSETRYEARGDEGVAPRSLTVPVDQDGHVSPAAEETIELRDTEWNLYGEKLTISVIDSPADWTHWLRVHDEGRHWRVTLNRAHRFTQSFANLPGMDLEPVLRLGVAIALAQIRAERSGSRDPRYMLAELNGVLTGPLAERQEV
jgi:Molecular chaperone, HSP90 family